MSVSTSDVLPYVRTTAKRLVDDLKDAARRTSGWSDLDRAQQLVNQATDRFFKKLVETGLVGRDTQLPSTDVWKIVGDILQHGELLYRARIKPRGYAGDDVMLTKIFHRQRCDHPFGQLFDEYFQSQDAPQAVRGRIRMAAEAAYGHADELLDHPYHLVSIGSGPGIDVELALQNLPPRRREKMQVTLVDFDPEALESARHRVAPYLPAGQLGCLRENIKRLPQRIARATSPRSGSENGNNGKTLHGDPPQNGSSEHAKAVPIAARKNANSHPPDQLLADADFIICLGILDYLYAADAEAMLRMFWEHLRPGGQMLVGNFAPHCRARPAMEWIGNWYLIYRTPGEFAALATAAGIPQSQFCIDAEPLGVDLFLRATKPLRKQDAARATTSSNGQLGSVFTPPSSIPSSEPGSPQ